MHLRNNILKANRPVVALNSWLQSPPPPPPPEGNVGRELSWSVTQTGPNKKAVHHVSVIVLLLYPVRWLVD